MEVLWHVLHLQLLARNGAHGHRSKDSVVLIWLWIQILALANLNVKIIGLSIVGAFYIFRHFIYELKPCESRKAYRVGDKLKLMYYEKFKKTYKKRIEINRWRFNDLPFTRDNVYSMVRMDSSTTASLR
ncbi:hypothetical protein CEY12_13690 [Chryseobacterium sp. T16E-39]|nr:hypothetical protein CEY12_13690 [Chryseobacterium sp. T16E-39]